MSLGLKLTSKSAIHFDVRDRALALLVMGIGVLYLMMALLLLPFLLTS